MGKDLKSHPIPPLPTIPDFSNLALNIPGNPGAGKAFLGILCQSPSARNFSLNSFPAAVDP